MGRTQWTLLANPRLPSSVSRRFFEITDAEGQKTHLQNLLVGPSVLLNTTDPLALSYLNSTAAAAANETAPVVGGGANETALACPLGEGLINATVAAWFT